MRKILSLLAILGFFLNGAIAQTDISIGTGTAGNTGTTYPTPIQDWFEGARAQFLYRGTELVSAGMGPGNINSIKFNVTGLNTFSGNIQEFTLKIGGTTVGSLTNNSWETGTTTKFGPVNLVPTLGVNTFTFSTPFFWNGTDNILIEICNGLPGNETDGIVHYTNNVTVPWTTGLAFNGSHTRVLDNAGNLCSETTTTNTGTQTTRPNIVFNWSPASNCAGTPTAGTATANPTTVCLGQSIALQATGVTVASGLAYQWQVSTNGGANYTNIAGATGLATSTTQVVTSLYRFRVVCTNTNDTSYTAGVQVTSPPVPGGNYTINKGQPTNWPGGTNFNSFNDAYNAIKCGISSAVVFDVVAGSGPYTEQLIMSAVPNTSAINTVTFKGNLNTLGFSSTNTNERAVIKLKGTKHIIFDSLIINANTGTYGYGVQLINTTGGQGADSNTIRNCIINTSTTATNQNFVGIVVNGTDAGPVSTGTVLCDFNTFDNNRIIGGYYGMTLVATFAGGANGNNRITRNKFEDFYIYGIYVVGSYGTLIEKNRLSRPTRSVVGDFNGIYFATEKSTNCLVSKNKITNPFGAALSSTSNFYGIYFNNADGSAGGGDNIVANNLIFKVNGNGPQYGIANNGSDYAQYFHNTVALDSLASTSTSTTRGFFQTTAASGLFFYDNLISITRGGTGAKHAIYLASGLLGGCDYNNYYVNAFGSQNYVGYFSGNRLALSDWQTATAAQAHDINSLTANPAFIDANNEDYHPGNAGMDDRGLFTGIITDDILDMVRKQGAGYPGGPDIGAFEFSPPPCSVPPVKGPTVLSATTICQNQPVLLNLNIGAYGSAQTFQWQTSPNINGPFTNLGNPKLTPDTTIISNTTLYFRVAVSCGSATEYTDTVLLTVNPALPAGTYTINDGQPTTYVPGVAGGNFNSFNAAKNAMNCGILGAVIFNVDPASGPYNEQLKLDSIKGTSIVNTITFNGNGRVITFNSTNSSERAVIKLNGADYITFDSLTIDASNGSFGYGVQLINNADTNTIRRCNIISSTILPTLNFAGIVVNATDPGPTNTGNTWCDGNTFDRNTITGGYYGITLYGNTTAANFINDNKITNNKILDFYSTGIQLAGTNNTLISGNTFSRPTRTTSAAIVSAIQFVTGISNNAKVSKNRFTNMFDGATNSTSTFYAVYHNNVDATVVNEVSNNVISDTKSNGPLYAFYNISADNVSYYHNTIAFDDTASTAFGLAVGFYQNSAATGIQFKNNMITLRRGGLGAKYGIYLNTTTSDVASDFNNVYINAGGTNNHYGYFTTNRTTRADWTTASTKDANSLEWDPLYVNPAIGDYSPQLKPLDNKGTPIAGITDDIYNRPRSLVTPDIGAFEFNPVQCQNPPVAGVATVNPTIICLENKITLNLTGHSPIGSITFQWQASADGINWHNISGILYYPKYDTLASVDTLYRCAVTCDNTTVYSTIAQTSLANSLLAGVYTIDPAITTTFPNNRNFSSFQHAVSTMQCGIAAKVVFNVAPGTYNEQIRIPYVAGTSSVKTVTFQSANGLASAVTLTNDATNPAANYTLKLDSATNFIFKNLTLAATNTTYGRVVEFATTSSFDSLLNCKIVAPVTTANNINVAGVFAAGLKGSNIVIKGNTISNGAYGIYFAGTGINTNLTPDHLIDSNLVNEFSYYGIYASYQKRAKLTRNTVQVTSTAGSNIYGLYATDCDSSYTIVGNTVTAANTIGNIYGIFVNNSDTSTTARGVIANNKVSASGTNTGNMYGLYITNSPGHRAVNNVVSLNNTGATSYGLYSSSTESQYYNNTVQISGGSVSNGVAAYFLNTAAPNISVKNNIFSNTGGGRAMYVSSTNQSVASDYNMLYTSGATLVQRATPAGNYANLSSWNAASNWDAFSIVYKPAFATTADLMPDVANPDVWAMHGRGVQIPTNDYDYFNKSRPTTLTTGVPDLGAYEFLPPATTLPTVLTATPAVPVATQPQVFMYGTDTVMRITWGATAPPDITVRRYSGVVPPNIGGRPDSMYFYNKVESTAGGNFPFTMEQFYIDPWQGSIPDQYQIGLGRTLPSNAWLVGVNSRTDTRRRLTKETALTYFDKFTGFINPYAPPVLPDVDSSNRGKRFWVGYQRSWDFSYTGCPNCAGSNSQEMVLYLSTTDQPANVEVRVNGTSWVRNYTIPANTTRASDLLPKSGPDDARLLQTGLYHTGISITSDVPITAYAHEYANTNSGATMLFPVGVWGYEYYSLNNRQNYTATGAYTVFFVIADNDNTVVEITPSRPTLATPTQPSFPANVPFTVTLNKGDVYQVLGAMISGSDGEDLTGSVVKSIPNSQGKCYPIGFFSGSTRTGLGCGTSVGSSGDLLLQQVFPYQAWGKKYFTAPTSLAANISSFSTNIFRVMVKDPATVVTRNGVPMTGLVNNRYYQYESNTADIIQADRPIMMSQYMSSSNGCPNTGGNGDPSSFILSPIEQAIKGFSGFYRNSTWNITNNYLAIIIPTNGMNSLKIDGQPWNSIPAASKFSYVPTNYSGYTVAIRRWDAGAGQSSVESDSAYVGLVYGQGSVESYGYNVGTLVKTLTPSFGIINDPVGVPPTAATYNCVGTPIRFNIYIPLKPTSIKWKFSATPNITPNADSLITNPVPVDSTIINFVKYYIYTVQQTFLFSSPGLYGVQIDYTHPDIESCDNSYQSIQYVQVVPGPKTDFAINFGGCEGNTASFVGDDVTAVGGLNVSAWSWTFHDNSTVTGKTSSFTYNTPGTYDVKLHTSTADGCVGDSIKQVVVNPKPVVEAVADSLVVCSGSDTTFRVLNPLTGAVYNWFTTPTGGTPIFTGPNYTITNVTTPATFYIEGTSGAGCTSVVRKKVTVNVYAPLTPTVVTFTSSTATTATFNWTAVPNASSYQVSVNNGPFITPSSGTTGLTHTVTGVGTLGNVCIVVRAIGAISCQTSTSTSVCGCAISNVQVVQDSIAVCNGANATFNVQSPVTGVTYSWFSTPTGGTALATGPSFTVNNVTGNAVYYVEQSNGTCTSPGRTRVVVSVFTPLAQTTVTAGATTATTVTFNWTAVTGAVGYQVSVNGGAFVTPSSGATGLTHTVTGLGTLQQVCIVVRAIGQNTCQNSNSASVCGCTNSAAVVAPPTASVCPNTTTTFTITSPATGVTYNWFTTATGGTPIATGTSFTTPAINATTSYYVEQVNTATGCISSTRTSVTVTVLSPLPPAVVRVDSLGANFVTFAWNAVPGATGYQVSTDNGVTWNTPSSGATGLTHTVAPLTPLQEVTLIVRALGNIPCQNSISAPVTGRARPDEIFIPNTFTPNGDGVNDVLMVYGYTIRSMQFMVFNQWGQKIFESSDQRTGWDGRYKGKMQPSGVYMYVSKMTLIDGSVITRRGSINLVR